jgi:PKD repeat protein
MRSSLILAALVAGALSVAGVSAKPKQQPAKPPFPQLELPEKKLHGKKAIDALGERLPEVAAWYRQSPGEFRALLLHDRRMKIDRKGRLFVEEELDAPLAAPPPGTVGSPTSTGQLVPYDETFRLHSKPGSKRTIYLNFKGATLTNTAWNSSAGQTTINARPFDLDGVPYSFSTTEMNIIQYVWQRVAEDFAPFDVDVTTEEPAAGALTRSGTSDDVYGTTALITYNDFYTCQCGGVAYVGIFDDTSDYLKPALAFYNSLGNGNEKYTAEAISHEVGHNLGLMHDGTSTLSYYTGHSTGSYGWAPIMGVGYYQPLVQWSKGEYADANNVQDDYVVMANNGVFPRDDDHGNAPGTASALSASVVNGVASLAGAGIIETPADVDVFSFTAGAGTITLNVNPAARSANLDIQAELRNGAGTLLASANPAEALNATISYTNTTPGTFYLTVQGVGKGDPLAGGYSDYGSLGEYSIDGTVQATAGQPPVAALSAAPTSGTAPLTVNFSAAGSTDPDGSIVAYAWNFGDGTAGSGASTSHTYQQAGNYVATVTVTDNTGLTASKSVTITVNPRVTTTNMYVADIAMGLSGAGKNARAKAVVTVRDADGRAVPGATVTGTWSGLVSGSGSAVTDGSGAAALQSPNSKKSGTFVFAVTGVSLSGYVYKSDLNTETSDSITR